MDELITSIKNLQYNKIWVTKKSRMAAEARMNSNNVYSQVLVNYYTFVVLSFSIWSLIKDDPKKVIALFTVIASVGLFGISLILSSLNFREKAIAYRESYLELGELEIDAKVLLQNRNLEQDELLQKYYELEMRYNQVMTKSDNHGEIDYLSVIKKTKELKIGEWLRYTINKLSIYLLKFVLLVLPFALIIWHGW